MRFWRVTQKQRLVPPGSASELAVIIARNTGHRPDTRNMVEPPPSQFQAKETAPSPEERMMAIIPAYRKLMMTPNAPRKLAKRVDPRARSVEGPVIASISSVKGRSRADPLLGKAVIGRHSSKARKVRGELERALYAASHNKHNKLKGRVM